MLIRLDLIQHLLVAWSPSDWLQLTYVHETGIWQTVSRNMEVFRYRDVHVLARTIILESGGQTRFYLSLSVLHGRGARPQIVTVTQNGDMMPYEMHDRLCTFCIDHCLSAEIGQIPLTITQFRMAANEGMTLKVADKHRDYFVQIPSRLFYSALQTANLLEPAAKPLP